MGIFGKILNGAGAALGENPSMLQGLGAQGLRGLLTPENMQLLASGLMDLDQGGGPQNLLAMLEGRKKDAREDQERADKIATANAPKVGIDGGTAYSIGKDGTVKWGEQRPQSPSEVIAARRAAEADEQNEWLRQFRRDQLLETSRHNRVGEGTASYRARKAPAGRGGATAGGLPPGFRIRGQ